MGEIEQRQIGQEMGFKENDNIRSERLQWVLTKAKEDVCGYELTESDSDDFDDSLESSSSSEAIEDSSSSSSSSPSSSYGPLFELSELMAQLPIKRGISKFYQGKSESFASLTSVKSIEDLAKKGKYCSRSRSMKSYGGGLDGQSQRLSPKATIAKNNKGSSTRSSIFSSLGKMSSLMAN